MLELNTFIYSIDLIGTLVFAISGVLTAVEKKFDFVGAVIIGTVTAIGGGTVRDLLIGATPVGWLKDLNYLIAILAGVLICYLFYQPVLRFRKGLFLFDTIGISLFSMLGVEKTLEAGLSPIIAITMGVVSAVFGGVIRDILTNRDPLIFRKEIYATACFAGGVVYVLSNIFLNRPNLNLIIGATVVIAIRSLAVKFHWTLPFTPRNWIS